MKRAIWAVGLAAFVGAGAGAPPAVGQGKVSGDVVKIGVLTDMTGPYADLGGPGSVVAAQMAIDDFGGKVLGKPIQLVSADHQNKADVAATRAREWFDRDGVDMITDLPNSGAALAVSGIAKEKNKVVMITGAAATALTNASCNANTVHYAYDTYALANIAGKQIVKQGGDTWFFITADYAFGASLEKDTTDVIIASGGKVLGAVKHPLGTTDFSSYLLQAQASKAKIIGLANAGGDVINAIKSASEFGITKGGQNLAALLIFITDIHSLGLEATQGLMVTEGWYWDLNAETRKFGDRFFSKHKAQPTMDHAGVYSAVLTYLKAVQAAGTDDAPSVMAKIKSTPINDVFAKGGIVRADGRMIHEMYLMQVKKPSESKRPWDYYNIKATIPGDQAFQPLSKSTCSLVTAAK
ncbi:MAG TPA: ABC transporter substrate-binding protein [Thermoanaerobaculia bacterium]